MSPSVEMVSRCWCGDGGNGVTLIVRYWGKQWLLIHHSLILLHNNYNYIDKKEIVLINTSLVHAIKN